MTSIGSDLLDSIQDLRRRRVFRIAGTYALASWIVLQLAEVTFEPFGIGHAVMRGLVVAVVLGFLVVMLGTWIADRRAGRGTVAGHNPPLAPSGRRRWIQLGIVSGLTLFVAAGAYALFGNARPPVPSDKSIAVLPFVNMSNDPSNEYFGDGLAEELLNVLARVENLRVAARTSSFAYRGRNTDVRAIGDALNVSTVLEGSVRKSENHVRVTVQLVDAGDGFHLWSDTYDRELDDIFAIQEEIADSVLDALRVTLMGDEAGAVAQPPTESVDAYDLYLLGRHHWHRRTEEGLTAAVDYFQDAIDLDQGFARAYSGLADTYLLLAAYGNRSGEEVLPKAETAAVRALEINPELAEAHASMGLIREHRGQLDEATPYYRRAMELNPDYAMAHMWYGNTLKRQGQVDKALQHYRRAYALEPMSLPVNINLAYSLPAAGYVDEAATHLQRLMRLEPDNASHYAWMLASNAHQAGRLRQAVTDYRHALDVDPWNAAAAVGLAAVHLDLGVVDQARAWTEHALALDRTLVTVHEVAAHVALAQARPEAALKRMDDYLAWLKRPASFEEASAALIVSLAAGARETAARHAAHIESLYAGEVTPDMENFGALAGMALYYQYAGERQALQQLAERGVAVYDRNAAEGLRANDWRVTAGVLQLSNGATDAGVALLEDAVDNGWRQDWLARLVLAEVAPEWLTPLAPVLDDARSLAGDERQHLAAASPVRRPPLPARTMATTAAADAIGDIAGYYGHPANPEGMVHLWSEDGKPYVASLDQPRQRLIAGPSGQFFVAQGSASFEPVYGADDTVEHAIHRVNGKDTRLRRLDFRPPEPIAVDPDRARALLGRYDFGKLGVVVVTSRAEGLRIQRLGQRPLPLIATADGGFAIEGTPMRVSFELGGDNGVRTAVLHIDGNDVEGTKVE